MDSDESIEHEHDDAMDLGLSVAYFDRSSSVVFTEEGAQIICSTFQRRLDPAGGSWKSLSDAIVDFYRREFQKHASWDPRMIRLCSVLGDRRLEDDTLIGCHLLGMRRKEQRRCSHLYRKHGRSIGSRQSFWHPPSKTKKIVVAGTKMPLLMPRTPVVHCLFARLKRTLVKVERLLTCTLRIHTHIRRNMMGRPTSIRRQKKYLKTT